MSDPVMASAEWARALHGAHVKENDDGGKAVWALVEMLGHRRIYGLVSEVQIAGAGMLRVDVPFADGGWQATQFVAPASLYALTPMTEDAVRKWHREQQETRSRYRQYDRPALMGPADDDEPLV